MITKRDIVGIILMGTIISFLILFLILFKINPEEAGIFKFVFFYLSMFFSLSGLFFLIGFSTQSLLKKTDSLVIFQSSLYGVLLSLLFVGMIILRHAGYFSILNVIFLLVFIIFLEFVFSKR